MGQRPIGKTQEASLAASSVELGMNRSETEGDADAEEEERHEWSHGDSWDRGERPDRDLKSAHECALK